MVCVLDRQLKDKLEASLLKGPLLALGSPVHYGHEASTAGVFLEYHDLREQRSEHKTPKREIVSSRTIYYRFKPFNLFRRGDTLYFVAPRLASFKWKKYNTYTDNVSFALAFEDVGNEHTGDDNSISPVFIISFNQGGKAYELRNINITDKRTGIIEWAADMVANTSYTFIRRRLMEVPEEKVNELIGIDVYQINISKKYGNPLNLAYIFGETSKGRPLIKLMYLLRVGYDTSLRAVISDPYYQRKGSTRFIAVGYDKEMLKHAFGSDKLDYVDINLKIKNIQNSLKHNRHLKKFLEYANYKINLGRLLTQEIYQPSTRGMQIALPGMRKTDIDEMLEIDHFFRRYDIDVFSRINYFNPGKQSKSLIRIALDKNRQSYIAIESRDNVTYVRQLYGLKFSSKSPYTIADEHFLPHFFIDTVVVKSKALAISYKDDDGSGSLSILSTAQSLMPETYLYAALRNLLRDYLDYGSRKQLGLIDPTPCKMHKSGAASWKGYFNLKTLANQFLSLILDNTNSGLVSYYQRLLNDAKRLIISLDKNAFKYKWRDLFNHMIAWSMANLFIKAAVSVLSPSFIENIGVACDKDNHTYNVYIIENVNLGAGFVDLLEQDATVLGEIVNAMEPVAYAHTQVRQARHPGVLLPVLQLIINCINNIKQELNKKGVPSLPLEVFRYVLYYVVDECKQSDCKGLPACKQLANFVKKSQQNEEKFRSLLATAYDLAVSKCWDGCLACVHISRRDLPEGLTPHEQIVYVSRTVSQVLARLAGRP